jgi:hypothetical protein
MGTGSLLFFKGVCMKYKVDDELFDTAEEAVRECIDEDYHWDDDYFEEWINNIYDHVDIAGTTYYPYDILDNMDSDTLYDLRREYCNNENERDEEEAVYEVENLDAGEFYEVHYRRIEAVAEEEEEEEVKLCSIEELRERLANRQKEKIDEDELIVENNLMEMFMRG